MQSQRFLVVTNEPCVTIENHRAAASHSPGCENIGSSVPTRTAAVFTWPKGTFPPVGIDQESHHERAEE